MTFSIARTAPITRIARTSVSGDGHTPVISRTRIPAGLWRAMLAGDRQSIRVMSDQYLRSLDGLEQDSVVAQALGIAACAHATTVDVVMFGDIEAWLDDVERQIGAVRLQLSDFGMGTRISLRRPFEEIESTLLSLRTSLAISFDNGWTEPGELVRGLCRLGDLHLAHEVAMSMSGLGDHQAGRNCRAAMIRSIDNEEALRLTAQIIESGPTSYSCNTRVATLMDAFALTGAVDYRNAALEVAKMGLGITDLNARRSAYTFRAVSRVLRTVDGGAAEELHRTGYAAERLYNRGMRECDGTCLEIGLTCLCRHDIHGMWLHAARQVSKAGLHDTALLMAKRVRADHPDLALVVDAIVFAGGAPVADDSQDDDEIYF